MGLAAGTSAADCATAALSPRRFFDFGGEEKQEAPGRAPMPEDITEEVFFDIAIGGEEAGRIVIGLYGDVVPKTVENFRTYCVNDQVGNSYRGSIFHRILPGYMCQGGDFVNFNGSGSRSIFGGEFEDESFELEITKPGLLVMANSGPDTNGCQFFITTRPLDWLNGKHVVFGEIVEGMDV